MPLTRVEIEKFNKVLIVYNQNSGKQFFANMFARINEVYKRLKDIYGSKRIDLYDIKSFSDLDNIAEKVSYIKRDDVIAAANGVKLHTVYKLLPKENEQ